MDEKMIGLNIIRLREEEGLSQQQVVNKLHVTFQAVSKWGTGITVPDVSMLPALAVLFCVSIDDLFREQINEVCRRMEAGISYGAGRIAPVSG